jgi:hypothetical protein
MRATFAINVNESNGHGAWLQVKDADSSVTASIGTRWIDEGVRTGHLRRCKPTMKRLCLSAQSRSRQYSLESRKELQGRQVLGGFRRVLAGQPLLVISDDTFAATTGQLIVLLGN